MAPHAGKCGFKGLDGTIAVPVIRPGKTEPMRVSVRWRTTRTACAPDQERVRRFFRTSSHLSSLALDGAMSACASNAKNSTANRATMRSSIAELQGRDLSALQGGRRRPSDSSTLNGAPQILNLKITREFFDRRTGESELRGTRTAAPRHAEAAVV